MSQKAFAPILIVIVALALIGLIGGTVYLAKQSPKPAVQPQITQSTPTTNSTEEISNWKTILNEQISVTFKYPDTLLPFANTPQVPDNMYFGFNAFNNGAKRDHQALTENDLELEVVIYKPVKTSIEPYLSAINAADSAVITQPFPGITGSYTKVKTITSGTTQTAVIYAEPTSEFSEYDAIIVDSGKNVALVRLMTGSHTKRQELLPVLEKILSTFRFSVN